MATCELKGELKCRDGQTNRFAVTVEENFTSMITGVKKLSADISEVLTGLVEQEKGSTGNSKDVDDDGEDESDEEDDNMKKNSKTNPEPPKKRKKT